jgi:hypothetical protein
MVAGPVPKERTELNAYVQAEAKHIHALHPDCMEMLPTCFDVLLVDDCRAIIGDFIKRHERDAIARMYLAKTYIVGYVLFGHDEIGRMVEAGPDEIYSNMPMPARGKPILDELLREEPHNLYYQYYLGFYFASIRKVDKASNVFEFLLKLSETPRPIRVRCVRYLAQPFKGSLSIIGDE